MKDQANDRVQGNTREEHRNISSNESGTAGPPLSPASDDGSTASPVAKRDNYRPIGRENLYKNELERRLLSDEREYLQFGAQRMHLDDVSRITTALRDVNRAVEQSDYSPDILLLQKALMQKALQLTSLGQLEEALHILEELRLFALERPESANGSFHQNVRAFGWPRETTGIEQARILLQAANWDEIEARFAQIFPMFTHRLTAEFPRLTYAEIKICMLIKVNRRTKDIAHLLQLSERTIENHRNRIRKKLQLLPDQSLYVFLSAY